MVRVLSVLLALVPCVLQAQNREELKSLPVFERAVAIVKHFEGWHGPEAGDYVGYGHRVLPGESLSHDLTEEEADSLLRADLLARCEIFRRFGADSLLLATLSYQVGHSRLLGYGKYPKSRLVQKLEQGDRGIYREYVSFRCWKGKVVPSIEKRRKVEFEMLFEP